MTSITTLGYGLTVRATDLVTAAQAWPGLRPTFRFFDLLLLRRRNGTLSSSGLLQGLIDKVPVEVWEEMKHWTVLAEMEDAEHRFLAPFLDWIDEDPKYWDVEIPARKSWDLIRNGIPGCRPQEWLHYSDAYNDMLDEFKRGDATAFAPIHRLVASFGLALPLSRTITLDPQKWSDLDDVVLITTPSRVERDGSSYPTISAEAGYDEQDEHTLVNVSLDLPRNANLRFVRFIRTFGLEVVEVSQSTLRSVAPGPDVKNDSRKGLAGIKQEEVKTVREVKPRWMLYTSCWGDW
ncbi:uncharacterized protein JCM6883_005820 [Sporobolomyces salmoneus]|uniref:uncharacterized protein n=1 Tax=Sporobolomyces salmoneus TaxID=183962 RepID=UPI003181C86A